MRRFTPTPSATILAFNRTDAGSPPVSQPTQACALPDTSRILHHGDRWVRLDRLTETAWAIGYGHADEVWPTSWDKASNPVRAQVLADRWLTGTGPVRATQTGDTSSDCDRRTA